MISPSPSSSPTEGALHNYVIPAEAGIQKGGRDVISLQAPFVLADISPASGRNPRVVVVPPIRRSRAGGNPVQCRAIEPPATPLDGRSVR